MVRQRGQKREVSVIYGGLGLIVPGMPVMDGCLADWMRIRRTCVLVLDVCLCFALQKDAWLQIASISMPFPVENTQWCYYRAVHTSVETEREILVYCPSTLKWWRPLSLQPKARPASLPVSSLWSKSNSELLLLYMKPPEPLWHHDLNWLIIEFRTFCFQARVCDLFVPPTA